MPIAGLPEPSPYDLGTAYYRCCMGVNSPADGGGDEYDMLCLAMAACRLSETNTVGSPSRKHAPGAMRAGISGHCKEGVRAVTSDADVTDRAATVPDTRHRYPGLVGARKGIEVPCALVTAPLTTRQGSIRLRLAADSRENRRCV